MEKTARDISRPLIGGGDRRDPKAREDDGVREPSNASLLANCLAAARSLGPILVWGVLPVVVIAAALAGGYDVHYAGDFHYAYWPAAQRILHGASPYLDPGAPQVARAIAFVYPAVGALLLAPFALLPHELADAVFTALSIAAAPLTLRALGIRDWRVHGALLLCLPVISGWLVGNVTLFLGLGVALLWRHRDRPVAAGLLAAMLVSFKLFLWPLGLWLLATRRYAALGWTAASGAAINLVAWAVLGFDEIGRYRQLLHALADHRDDVGFSVISVALREGVARGPSYALAGALAAVVAVACVVAGRRGRDAGALALAVLVCLLATPIVQLHYFALLLVPFALARPRLGISWLLPLAMWLCSDGRPVQAVMALALAFAMVAVCQRDRVSRPAARPALGEDQELRAYAAC